MPTSILPPVAEHDGDDRHTILDQANEAVNAAGPVVVLAAAGFEVGRRVRVVATHDMVVDTGDPALVAQLDPYLGALGVISEVIACPTDPRRLPPQGDGSKAFALDENGKPLCFLTLLFVQSSIPVVIDGVPQHLVEVVDAVPTAEGVAAVQGFVEAAQARRSERTTARMTDWLKRIRRTSDQ